MSDNEESPKAPAPPEGEPPKPAPAPASSNAAASPDAAKASPPKPAAPAPAAAKPAVAPKPAVPSGPDENELAAMRAKVVAVLEEKKRVGEAVTVTSQHKEISLTGQIVRIEPNDGFVVIEHVDGRRKGIYYILGGSLKTQDGQEVPFPVDGVPR